MELKAYYKCRLCGILMVTEKTPDAEHVLFSCKCGGMADFQGWEVEKNESNT